MRASLSACTPAALAAAAWTVVLLGAFGCVSLASASDDQGFSPPPPPPPIAVPAHAAAPLRPAPRAVLPRKLLRPAAAGMDVEDVGGVRTQRADDGCAGAEDIAIYQGHGTPLPSGVPSYTVDVMNRCSSGDGCAIADIHVRCGWFSSVGLVDPSKFRRLGHDDCLLNDGRPLLAGDTVSFEYSNSFPYPLSVATATCVGSSPP